MVIGTFKTDSIKQGSDKLHSQLDFVVSGDSICIFPSGNKNFSIVSFRVISKNCSSSDGQSGKWDITLNVLLLEDIDEKKCVLKMFFVGEKLDFIELLYPNAEPRIFSTTKQ